VGSPPRDAAARRRATAVPVILFAALVAAVYAGTLLSRRVFVGRDLVAYNLPIEKSIHDAYARGRLPVWSPDVSGGRPLLPNPNAGALYPARMLLSRVSFPAAMRIFPIAHWALAGAGAMLLLVALGASASAAWIAGAGYAFSGVAVSEVFYPHIQPGMALLPWLLWAAARSWRRPAGRPIALALFLCLDFLAADVFTVGVGVAAVALWIAVEGAPDRRRRAWRDFAVATGLAILAALPQIAATALWIPETNRAALGMTLGEAAHFSISPWRLLELVVPYPFGPTWTLDPRDVWGWGAFAPAALGLFTTLYAGALAPMAAGTMARRRDPGVRFAAWLLLLSAAAAILPGLAARAAAGAASPIALRNPEKFAFAATLALALLSGLAFDVYRARGRGPRGGLAIAALLALLAAGAAVVPAFPRAVSRALGGAAPAPESAAAELPGALAEGGLLWIATLGGLALARRRGRAPRAAALALLTAVPIAATHRIPIDASEAAAFAPTRLAREIRRDDPSGAFRTLGESIYARPGSRTGASAAVAPEPPADSWIYYTSSLWNRGTVFNYDFDAGDLARVESLRRLSGVAAATADGGSFFANLSLRWGVRPRSQLAVPGFAQFGGNAGQAWDRNAAALPDVRFALRWMETSGPLESAAALPHARAGDLVIETGRRAAGEAAGSASARVVERTPELLRIDTVSERPAWLFVLRAWWPYRDVVVDSRPVETVPAYLAFTAIPLPEGRHAVVWRERVPGGDASRFGPIAAGIIAVLLLVSGSRRT
jgi:hypothetical protein